MGIEMGSGEHPWEMRRAREWLAGQAPVVEVDGWHVEPTGVNEPAVVEETIADLAALLRDAWGSGHLAAAGDELAAERRGYERGVREAAAEAAADPTAGSGTIAARIQNLTSREAVAALLDEGQQPREEG